MNKKIIIAGIVLSIALSGVVYANYYPRNIINLVAHNSPDNTILETEMQLNSHTIAIFHAVSDGMNGLKEKEVRIAADHIVNGASVVAPGQTNLPGDGDFYVQDGEAFFQGRIHNQIREVESHPQMTLGQANYNVVLLSGTIEAIATEGWREGDTVTLRFRDPNFIKHLGQADPGFARIKFKNNLDHKMAAYSTLQLGLDKYDNVTHQLTWYEL